MEQCLVSKNSVDNWTKSILFCIKNPKEIKKMVENNQKYIKKFSEDLVIQKIQGLYDLIK